MKASAMKTLAFVVLIRKGLRRMAVQFGVDKFGSPKNPVLEKSEKPV